MLAWTVAILVVFRDVALLRGALYYFDVTEINYPYRDFLAHEIRLGRFSRWLPNLYCGLPLYSESQAGYWHPLKYLLYPWMATWKALNLDTVLSIWLAGAGTYGWLRRHVGALGGLTGAGAFALGGFTWAHLIHTSMINALASVPFVIWAMEVAWDRRRWWPVGLGALAIAFQVFAGHLQDTILTTLVVGLYALLRVSSEGSWVGRRHVLASTTAVIVMGAALAAVQWVPSKELLDRSPRAGGLTWGDLTYGSWHPELLPTVLMHEAYGTRARDTDWMDGFYPYHEMDTYLGVLGLFLAAVGARAFRNRWVACWLVIAAVGVLLMLGRFTFLMDFMHRVPVVGSSRIPVRFHLWVSLASAALVAVGVDRLSRPGSVRLRGPVLFVLVLILASVAILCLLYRPVWTQPNRWVQKDQQERFAWLGAELLEGGLRVFVVAIATLWFSARAVRASAPKRRLTLCAIFPILLMADLGLAHRHDVAVVDPRYWTDTPASVAALRADPSLIRMYGESTLASGEPGYASKPINPFPARDLLAWSLPAAWNLPSTGGETPIISSRRIRFTDWRHYTQLDIEGLSHILSATPSPERLGPWVRQGYAYLHKNPRALPRARLLGQPVYASNEREAAGHLARLGPAATDRIVVEDADRPLAPDQTVQGTARIEREEPERVEIRTISQGPAYLFLADTYDPGWSATLDGKPVPVRPAYVAFRAVLVPAGEHQVVFSYRPVGILLGGAITGVGLIATIFLVFIKRPVSPEASSEDSPEWPHYWPHLVAGSMFVIVVLSLLAWDFSGQKLSIQSRWAGGGHRFTWAAGIEAMKPPPPPLK